MKKIFVENAQQYDLRKKLNLRKVMLKEYTTEQKL